jgi:hypothetical protein
MPALNLKLDFELTSDVNKVRTSSFSNILLGIQISSLPAAEPQHYLLYQNPPAAYNEVLAAV